MSKFAKRIPLAVIAGGFPTFILLANSKHTTFQACYWLIEIERVTKMDMSRFEVKHLQEMTNLLIDGIKLVKKISEMVKWIINLHADKGRPMSKSVVMALCRLIEVMKCFQFMFHKKMLPLVYAVLLISQHLSHKALTLLRNIRVSYRT